MDVVPPLKKEEFIIEVRRKASKPHAAGQPGLNQAKRTGGVEEVGGSDFAQVAKGPNEPQLEATQTQMW
jgi:hypothetical protein